MLPPQAFLENKSAVVEKPLDNSCAMTAALLAISAEPAACPGVSSAFSVAIVINEAATLDSDGVTFGPDDIISRF